MENKANITTAQQRVLDAIEQTPLTTAEIADELGVTTSTVRDHLRGLRAAGVAVVRDGSGGYTLQDGHPTNTTREVGSSKSRITREANEWLVEMQEWVNDLLESEPVAIADGGLKHEPGHEDVVFHRTDDHIGEYRVDEFGNVLFDEKIAVNRVKTTFERGLNLIHRQEAAGTVIDTVHVLPGGDIVTGEGIYNGQPWETCLTLDKQVELAAELYFEQIATLATQFPSVQVVCQPGNHGELRVDARSQNANADSILYAMLDHMVRTSSLTNVTFIRNESTKFTNFDLRGHRGHIRHGQDSPFHIGTPSAKSKWKTWLLKHRFDIAYRGHYHEWRIEPVLSRPVIMSGSICPPGDFEESLAVWSEPSGTIHGVSDEYALTWFYPVYFDGGSPDAE